MEQKEWVTFVVFENNFLETIRPQRFLKPLRSIRILHKKGTVKVPFNRIFKAVIF